MTDAVADYGLRLELTRVLLQLRNVQLQALDDPMYRALEVGAEVKSKGHVVVTETLDFVAHPIEHELTQACAAIVSSMIETARQAMSDDAPQRRKRNNPRGSEHSDKVQQEEESGVRTVNKFEMLERQLEELKAQLAAATAGTGQGSSAAVAATPMGATCAQRTSTPSAAPTAAKPDMTSILAAAKDLTLRRVGTSRGGAAPATPTRGSTGGARPGGVAADNNLQAHLLRGLQRLKPGAGADAAAASPASDAGSDGWSPNRSPVGSRLVGAAAAANAAATRRALRRMSSARTLVAAQHQQAPPSAGGSASVVSGGGSSGAGGGGSGTGGGGARGIGGAAAFAASRVRDAHRRQSTLRREVILGGGADEAASTPQSQAGNEKSLGDRKRSHPMLAVPLPMGMAHSVTTDSSTERAPLGAAIAAVAAAAAARRRGDSGFSISSSDDDDEAGLVVGGASQRAARRGVSFSPAPPAVSEYVDNEPVSQQATIAVQQTSADGSSQPPRSRAPAVPQSQPPQQHPRGGPPTGGPSAAAAPPRPPAPPARAPQPAPSATNALLSELLATSSARLQRRANSVDAQPSAPGSTATPPAAPSSAPSTPRGAPSLLDELRGFQANRLRRVAADEGGRPPAAAAAAAGSRGPSSTTPGAVPPNGFDPAAALRSLRKTGGVSRTAAK